MSKGAQTILSSTRDIPNPNRYIQSMYREFRDWVFDEKDCLYWRGLWRKKIFKVSNDTPLHLEIGPGNGTHFLKRCEENPQDYFLAVELKYKPLIQTIRRVRKKGLKNGRVIRYNAKQIQNLFQENELNSVYIHFPDPWPEQRRKKHRLVSRDFVEALYNTQRRGATLEFKTDVKSYFLEAKDIFIQSGYHILSSIEDLHQESGLNLFITQFESLFVRKNFPIYYLKLKK